MSCTLKTADHWADFQAQAWPVTPLQVQNEVLVMDQANPLCLQVIGDLSWGVGRTWHHSQCMQDAHSHAVHPQDH